MSARTGIISKIAGIDVLLERFDQQDRTYDEFRNQTGTQLEAILAEQKRTNGRVTTLERKLGLTDDRAEQKRAVELQKITGRQQLVAAAVGAGAIGAVTILLHLAGIA